MKSCGRSFWPEAEPNPAMARMTPAFLKEHESGVMLSIKLTPRAPKNEIGPPLGPELKVKVQAPPVDAAANDALLKLLSERLRVPRSAIQLIRGHTSRHKTVFVQGV